VFGSAGNWGSNWSGSSGRGATRPWVGTATSGHHGRPRRWRTDLPGFRRRAGIQPAAYNQCDVAGKEPRAAFEVNALAVPEHRAGLPAMECAAGALLDGFVFHGFARHTYAEDDPTHPLGLRGYRSWRGELYAQAYLDRVLIVRTFGAVRSRGPCYGAGQFCGGDC